ncbi:MAG: AsmA-like C-terminal region-containing protein [Flavobacteriales bacterium]|nr:AsmA-like C-terminal region-containing protein [Flavobacteriales bacterium]
MRIFKVLAWLLAALMLAFALLAWYVSENYGQILKKNLIEQLNLHLKSEVKVGDIKVSSWRKIPFLSLEFVDVIIMEPKDYTAEPDTLMALNKVYFQFDLWDLYNGDFILKRLEINGGDVKFVVNKEGAFNYLFWNDSPDTTSSAFELKLSQIRIADLNYSYTDHQLKFGVGAHVKEMELAGDISAEEFYLKYKGHLKHTAFEMDGERWVRDGEVLINSGIGGDGKVLRFQKGELQLNKHLNFGFVGEVGIEEVGYYNFNIDGNHLTLKNALAELPVKVKHYLKDYESAGDVQFKCNLSGEQNNHWDLKFHSDFKLEKGVLKSKLRPLSLKSMYFVGSINYGINKAKDGIKIDSIYCDLPDGNIHGNFKIERFDAPKLAFSARGETDLQSLFTMFPMEDIDTISGRVKFDMRGTRKLKLISSLSAFESGETNDGLIEFTQFYFRPSIIPLSISNATIVLQPRPKEVKIIKATGFVQSTSFDLVGNVDNLLEWASNSKALVVKADAKFGHIKVKEFSFERSSKTKGDSAVSFPIYFKISGAIDSLSGGKFLATHIESNITIEPGLVVANPIKFDAFNGVIDGKFYLVQQPKNSKFKFIGELANVDIQKLFYEFGEFGQNEITSENLRGTANAKGKVTGLMRNNIIDPNSIDATVKIEIANGEIIEYKTLISAADYLKENVVLKAIFNEKEIENRLRHVRFNKLHNEIFISDGQIIIPQMSLSTNFIDLNAEGTHDFDNNINYRMNFDASDLLFKKREYDTEYGYVTDDGTGRFRMFLRISGNTTNPIIEVDKERKKAYKKARTKKEENELKSVFKKEFGMFKKDTTVSIEAEEKDFEIEWGDSDEESKEQRPARTKDPKEEPKKPRKKGFKDMLKPIEHEKVEWKDE